MTSRKKVNRIVVVPTINHDDEKWVKDIKKKQYLITKEYITDVAVDDLLKLRKKESGGRPVSGDLSIIVAKYNKKDYNFVTKGYLKYRLGLRKKKEQQQQQNTPPPVPKTIVVNSNDSVISGLSLPPVGAKRVASSATNLDDDDDEFMRSKRARPNDVDVDDGLQLALEPKIDKAIEDKLKQVSDNSNEDDEEEDDDDDELKYAATTKNEDNEDDGADRNETKKNDIEYQKQQSENYDRLVRIASKVTMKDWQEYLRTGDKKRLEDVIARAPTPSLDYDFDDDGTKQSTNVSNDDVVSGTKPVTKANFDDDDDKENDDDNDESSKPAATTIKKLNLDGVSDSVRLELGLMQAALTYAHLRMQFQQVGRRMPKGQLDEIIDFAETQNELPPGSLSKPTFVARANKRRWSKTIPTSKLIPMLRKSGSFPLITASYG